MITSEQTLAAMLMADALSTFGDMSVRKHMLKKAYENLKNSPDMKAALSLEVSKRKLVE